MERYNSLSYSVNRSYYYCWIFMIEIVATKFFGCHFRSWTMVPTLNWKCLSIRWSPRSLRHCLEIRPLLLKFYNLILCYLSSNVKMFYYVVIGSLWCILKSLREFSLIVSIAVSHKDRFFQPYSFSMSLLPKFLSRSTESVFMLTILLSVGNIIIYLQTRRLL